MYYLFYSLYGRSRKYIIATGTPKEIEKETNTTNLREAFFKLIGGNYNEME